MSDVWKRSVLMSLLGTLRQPEVAYQNKGYDLWIPSQVDEGTLPWHYARKIRKEGGTEPDAPAPSLLRATFSFNQPTVDVTLARILYPILQDAVWLLCRQGILRPSPSAAGVLRPTLGDGFSLTAKGRVWIQSYTDADFAALLTEL